MFRDSYVETFASVGVQLTGNDGCSDSEIEEAEQRLQVEIPTALREFYLVAGLEPRINQFHNRLLAPEKWFVDAGHLIFLEENQSVVYWGIAADRRASSDAAIYQGVNRQAAGIAWHAEHERCSEFLNVMIVWHASFGGATAFASVTYVEELSTRILLKQNCEVVGEVNGMTAYRHPRGVLAFLKWEGPFQRMSNLPPWRLFAAASSAPKLEQIKESLPLEWEEWGSS